MSKHTLHLNFRRLASLGLASIMLCGSFLNCGWAFATPAPSQDATAVTSDVEMSTTDEMPSSSTEGIDPEILERLPEGAIPFPYFDTEYSRAFQLPDVYCSGDPVGKVDLTGLWPGQVHRYLAGAVMDFAMSYLKKSIQNHWEYATFFYLNGRGYSYVLPWTSYSPYFVNVGRVIEGQRQANKINSRSKLLKHKVRNIVATAHTHVYIYSGSNDFSSADASTSKTYRLNDFLVTPSGKLKVYNYRSGRASDTIGSFSTWHDTRTQASGHKCSRCVKGKSVALPR